MSVSEVEDTVITGTTFASKVRASIIRILKRPRKPNNIRGREHMLSFEEAQQRAWQAANELEELVGTRDETSQARRDYFATEYMALLAEKFEIAPPVLTLPTSEAMNADKE